MQKPSILITAVNGDIGSGAVRALRSEAGRLIGCDVTSYCPVMELLDGFCRVPLAAQKKNYIENINQIIKQEKIDFVLPISEPEIEVINSCRNEINLKPNGLLMNNPIIVETFLDKLATADYLNTLGIKVPKTMKLESFDNQFDFPVIVKSRKGCGSKKNWLIKNNKEMEQLRSESDDSIIFQDCIAQECIGTIEEEFTTGVFCDGKKTESITFRRKLGYGGLSIEAVYEKVPFLEEMAKNIAKETGLMGSINIQTRRTGDIYIPFEINPRLSSTLMFRKKFGFDDAVWWLNVLQNKGFSYAQKYKSGRAMRYLSERYFDMET
ncbi:MAG: ATP-grasp domain-containing protein [Desulfobacula sp.]|jgi:carbamoyl-phosphate synthase large subunit|nr:ATP-grasp domain-containing protein [Desulfobacula sp.]MBT6339486.1 ATP-grasp domain-containing protein [Desulfobacula sp.]MBT7262059.1 ATP-grasp domain-containing protein [Desulfobacula sp.]